MSKEPYRLSQIAKAPAHFQLNLHWYSGLIMCVHTCRNSAMLSSLFHPSILTVCAPFVNRALRPVSGCCRTRGWMAESSFMFSEVEVPASLTRAAREMMASGVRFVVRTLRLSIHFLKPGDKVSYARYLEADRRVRDQMNDFSPTSKKTTHWLAKRVSPPDCGISLASRIVYFGGVFR
jgi:hypothetical protein